MNGNIFRKLISAIILAIIGGVDLAYGQQQICTQNGNQIICGPEGFTVMAGSQPWCNTIPKPQGVPDWAYCVFDSKQECIDKNAWLRAFNQTRCIKNPNLLDQND